MNIETRKLIAEQKIRIYLLRETPKLADRALDFLVEAVSDSIEMQSHMAGEELDLPGIAEAARASEAGQLIYDALGAVAENGPAADLRALAELNPAERMTAARAMGIAR